MKWIQPELFAYDGGDLPLKLKASPHGIRMRDRGYRMYYLERRTRTQARFRKKNGRHSWRKLGECKNSICISSGSCGMCDQNLGLKLSENV